MPVCWVGVDLNLNSGFWMGNHFQEFRRDTCSNSNIRDEGWLWFRMGMPKKECSLTQGSQLSYCSLFPWLWLWLVELQGSIPILFIYVSMSYINMYYYYCRYIPSNIALVLVLLWQFQFRYICWYLYFYSYRILNQSILIVYRKSPVPHAHTFVLTQWTMDNISFIRIQMDALIF